MSDVGGPERRWGEGEVGAILQRAIELQQEDERQGPQALARRGGGASLAELEAMAKEVGLEPALVRRAVAELEARPRPVPISPWTGAPQRIVFERVLPGEVQPAAVESLLPIIQSTIRENGQGSMVGRTFTWTSTQGHRERPTTISVIPRDGVTTVRIEEPVMGPYFLLPVVFGSAPLMGLGAKVMHSPLAAGAMWLFFSGGTYFGARKLFQRQVRKRTEALQELFGRITAQLQSELDEPPRIAVRVASELEEPAPTAAPALERALPPAR
jgi:hypothetical protein